ncbi:uncharacterized protein LOC115880973 [Sitophilus oryzae]|uniref:Uncharacterized protein LOC115880973 n=1 Tax=Sitophilus oryzae TaxID=7048 RepID=A0A6J2XRP5_SITOR|nr:uncharacterized protein LOC115880973 [Sitophilus oryzae]
MALRICSAYCTISTDAVLVIAGLIPLHLAAEEKLELYVKAEINDEVKNYQRRGTYQKWQEEWDTSDKRRWTRKLIHNVEDWTSRKHGDVDYYITQFLSGHGVFMDFLHRIKKIPNGNCMYCDEIYDAEHTLFCCPRWERGRSALLSDVGMLTSDTLIMKMTKTSVGAFMKEDLDR